VQCIQPYRALSLPDDICFSDISIYNCEQRILFKGVISKSLYRLFNTEIHKKERKCGLKSLRKKNSFLLILPYKTWWKPRFPMDKRPFVEGYIANFGISLDILEFFRFGLLFFCF
jgi:hypothetical protein